VRRLLAALPLLALTACVQATVARPAAVAAGQELLSKRRVLAVVAHPDDADWYIGGTLHRLALAGAQVEVIVATNGEAGPNGTRSPDLAATRQTEQRAAGAINRYSELYFPGLPDRGVAGNPALLAAVRPVYARLQPDAVLIFDPSFPALPYLHSDHQGSARLFLEYWNTLGPDRPPVYLFQTRRPDVALDISSVLDDKVRALAQHVSQNGGNGERNRGSALSQGELFGLGAAETFRLLR
jgi:LmbE family N-acetylglucosaminyl deacetylase